MERPILFSSPMVQAILAGRKSQTRRTKGLDILNIYPFGKGLYKAPYQKEDWNWYYQIQTKVDDSEEKELICPYGKRGDILWVRETWQYIDFEGENNGYVYKATDPDWDTMEGWKWKPSIFMPKEACRIRLEITDIRVERLQDISEEDAIAEGIGRFTKDNILWKHGIEGWHWSDMPKYAKEAYKILWDSINGHGSWDLNPWVWVIEFRSKQ